MHPILVSVVIYLIIYLIGIIFLASVATCIRRTGWSAHIKKIVFSFGCAAFVFFPLNVQGDLEILPFPNYLMLGLAILAGQFDLISKFYGELTWVHFSAYLVMAAILGVISQIIFSEPKTVLKDNRTKFIEKMFLFFSIAGVIVLGVFLLLTSHQSQKENTQSSIKRNTFVRELNYQKNLSPERKIFEQELANLLSVAGSDKFFFGFGVTRKFDLDARRVFFTDEAWKDYMAYIESEKSILDRECLSRCGKSKDGENANTLHLTPRFDAMSQKYEEVGSGGLVFSVSGSLFMGAYDYGSQTKKFTLNLAIKGDLKQSSQFIIEKWQINLVEKGIPKHGL